MFPIRLTSLDKPLHILCLGAHCDDIEIGCGGTMLRLLAEHPGAVVHWTVFSGTSVRAPEFRASCRSFLGESAGCTTHAFPDGYFPHAWKEIKDCFEQMKSGLNPDLVFTHYRDDLHQDHRIISELTWNTFRNHLVLEYEIPKFDGDLGRPNFFVPLSEEICHRKIATIMAQYPSQAGKGWFTEDTFRALLRLRGVEAAGAFAEAFHARKLIY